MVTATMTLPPLPEGWSGDKDFKPLGTLSIAAERSIEPVGPHFLAHARRARHKRTFSEDDRIQAQERAQKVEDDDGGEISEPEDPLMLQRDAKDWKAGHCSPGGRSHRRMALETSKLAHLLWTCTIQSYIV